MDNENKLIPTSGTVIYAGFWNRFLAYWVDFLLIFPVSIIIQEMLGFSYISYIRASSMGELLALQNNTSMLWLTLLSVTLNYAYLTFCWLKFDGATPGKKLMAIKITKDNGDKLTLKTSIIRNLGYIVSGLVSYFFGMGYLWMIWDKKKQTVHDKLAKTVVVKTGKPPKRKLALALTILAFLLYIGFTTAIIGNSIRITLNDSEYMSKLYEDTLPEPMEPKNNTIEEYTTQFIVNGRIINFTGSYLEMTQDVTFADLSRFLENNPSIRDFYYEPFLYDLGDSGNWDHIPDFVKLVEEQSPMTIYQFYLDRNLFDPDSPSADSDLRIFYHLQFITDKTF